MQIEPRPVSLASHLLGCAAALLLFAAIAFAADPGDDARAVAALDTEYQAAVERNDAATMDRILADDFTLVLGQGKAYSKAELLADTRSGATTYEIQAEEAGTQRVRVSGDTAVVTALLRLKGVRNGQAFDRLLWFSDTYVRTLSGWRYFFGQASLPLPAEAAKP